MPAETRSSDAVLAVLEPLIGFATVSSESNRPLIDHAAALLRDLRADVEVVPSPDGAKASLWATIGPKIDGGVVLAGHSDVVPVAGQDWTSPPFAMEVRGSRAYGRGVADMKGFIACALASAPRLIAMNLKKPIHIALTYDEEVGCIGAPLLLRWLGEQGVKPEIAFIGEPTLMQVVNAHKGITVARTTLHGVEAHSSLAHKGVSAVGLAAQCIVLLIEMEAELAATRTNMDFLPAHTTISANTIQGGTAVNILAGEAVFEWNVRPIPGDDANAIIARFEAEAERRILGPLRDRFPTVALSTEIVANAPALVPEVEGRAESLAKQLARTNSAIAVPYAAEAGQFQNAGLSAVIIGPGSIEQAHKGDEWVELDQLSACAAFIERLGEHLSAA
ncbi:MAG TPA: acetylornithine deacetylase [Sphingobium sp.]|uniref:acetylornithine deacetylase n=1 Tax=Sphingobium sp. TaxID=1912891 RepID=UPI002ED00294